MATRNLLLLASVVAGLAGCGGGNNPAPRQPPPPAAATPAGCVAGSEALGVVSGDGQAGSPGAPLAERATVRLACESFANRGTVMPLAGETIQWQADRGLVDGAPAAIRQTDSDGLTSVSWTLATAFHPQNLVVSHVAASNRTVSATVKATVVATTTTATDCQDPGGTDHGAMTVTAADQAWTAAGSPHRGGGIRLDSGAVLSIEAGAVVCLGQISGTLIADGTAQAPIRLYGTSLPTATVLRHVHAQNVLQVGSVTGPARVIEDSSFTWTAARDPLACAQVVIGPGGAWVQRSVFSAYGSQVCAALRVDAAQPSPRNCGFYYCYDEQVLINARVLNSVGDAVVIDDRLQAVFFEACEVSSSGRHGIVVPPLGVAAGAPPAVAAQDCNLFGNGGDAIENRSSLRIDATRNWWGDPAGPTGANCDAVAGNVDAGFRRSAPLDLVY
jgi:hypothetical protein